MKINYIILILLLAVIVTPVMGAELKLESIGVKDVVQLSNVTGETVIRDTITKGVVVIASTNAGVKANKLSDYFKVSSDTAKAVFHSWATNLVPGTESVNAYIKDTKTGDVKLLKKHSRFTSISPDGRYVVYEYAGNYDVDLPAIYLYDTTTDKETFIAYTSGGNSYGWSTQEFTITNTTVWYNTTYPYPDVKGKTQRFFVIPADVKPIETKGVDIIKGGKL